jgi:hypothetical protein
VVFGTKRKKGAMGMGNEKAENEKFNV